MLETLRQPKWIVALVVVLALVAVFIRLGFWQLDRLQQRQLENEVGEGRIAAAPVGLRGLLDQTPADGLETLEYRETNVEGRYDTSEEILIRSQVELGQAGFHVITPLVGEDGTAVLVNRGWVPITMDTPPVEAAPERGQQTIEGWVHLTETRPTFGREEPPGDLDVLNRVDIERIAEQVPYDLLPVYVVAAGEGSNTLPVPVDAPDFSDEGPHLSYAVQWFGFAAIGLVGFILLLRRGSGRSR